MCLAGGVVIDERERPSEGMSRFRWCAASRRSRGQGLVGNLFEILPALTAALEEAKPHAV
jgi:hypothetical protein